MKRRLRRIAIGLVVLTVLLIATLAIYQQVLQSRYDDAMEQLSPNDLSRFAIAVPSEDDARPLLAQLKERASEDPGWRDYGMMSALGMHEEEDWAESEAWFATCGDVRPLIERIVSKPACSHPCDPAMAPYHWPTQITSFQAADEYLQWETRMEIRRGNASTAAALERAALLLELRKHLDARFFIGWAVRFTLENAAGEHVRAVAVANPHDAARLREWVADRPRIVDLARFKAVLRNERLCSQAASMPRYGGIARLLDDWEVALRPYVDDEETMKQFVRAKVGRVEGWALRSPWSRLLELRAGLRWLDEDARAIDALTAFDAETEARLRTMEDALARRWGDPVGSGCTRYARRGVTAVLERRARLAITDAGLAALAWRAEHGAWPDSLEDTSLDYEVTADGVVISSTHVEEASWTLE